MTGTILTGDFSKLIGQEAVVRALKNSFAGEKMPHAILFTGPDGTGKSMISMLLACCLNCGQKDNAPCGVCSSCRRIVSGTHPDVIIIEPQQTIKIDQVREVRRKFVFFAQEGAVRVCLIEDAHKLTAEAAASLLKILEEPPGKLVFMMNTPYPSRLPPTILSRCQVYRMQRVEEQPMRGLINSRVGAVAPEQIELALKLGEGIPGRTLSILQDEGWAERIDRVFAFGCRLAGEASTDRELVLEAREWASRDDLLLLLELLAFFLKDGLYAAHGAKDRQIHTDIRAVDFWQKLGLGSEAIESSLRELNRSRRMLLANVNVALALEAVFLCIRGILAE